MTDRPIELPRRSLASERCLSERFLVASYRECTIFRTPSGQFLVSPVRDPDRLRDAANLPAAYALCRTMRTL